MQTLQDSYIYYIKCSLTHIYIYIFDAQISLHNLVPITDSDASHIHCTLNCICKKDHDILYHGTMYHTPLNNTQFSIDAYNALIASIYLHQYFCILKILAHSVDFNELWVNFASSDWSHQ